MSIERIDLHGPLGEALAANRHGRLSHFIVDERSPAIARLPYQDAISPSIRFAGRPASAPTSSTWRARKG